MAVAALLPALLLTACGPSAGEIVARPEVGPGVGPSAEPLPVPPPSPIRRLRPDGEGVLFRLSVRGRQQEMLTLERDGRVVRVADTSVVSSTDDYTTWRLTPAGVARLVEAVEDSGVLSIRNDDFGDAEPGRGRSVGLFFGGSFVVEAHDLDNGAGFDAATLERRGRLSRLVDLLLDHGWLASEIVEPPGPFVPESMTILAGEPHSRSGLRPEAPFRPWPFDRSVEEMSQGVQANPYGEEELVVCLTGADVAPVFALLTGVNHAYLRVDDGRQWELNVRPQTPGYRLYGDPCAAG